MINVTETLKINLLLNKVLPLQTKILKAIQKIISAIGITCQWDSHLCLNLNVKISLVSLPQFTHAQTLHMHYWKAAYEYWQLLRRLHKIRQGSSWWERGGKDKRTRRNYINIEDVTPSPIKSMEWFILISEVMRDGVCNSRKQISAPMADMFSPQKLYNRGHNVFI